MAVEQGQYRGRDTARKRVKALPCRQFVALAVVIGVLVHAFVMASPLHNQVMVTEPGMEAITSAMPDALPHPPLGSVRMCAAMDAVMHRATLMGSLLLVALITLRVTPMPSRVATRSRLGDWRWPPINAAPSSRCSFADSHVSSR